MKDIGEFLTEAEFVGTAQRDLVAENWRVWNETPVLRANAERFYDEVYAPVRRLVGPLHVNSGYRCPSLNLRVGGVSASLHMLALAGDVVPIRMSLEEAMRLIAGAIRVGSLPRLDKVMIECGTWLHLQAARTGTAPRCLALRSDDGTNFRPYVA